MKSAMIRHLPCFLPLSPRPPPLSPCPNILRHAPAACDVDAFTHAKMQRNRRHLFSLPARCGPDLFLEEEEEEEKASHTTPPEKIHLLIDIYSVHRMRECPFPQYLVKNAGCIIRADINKQIRILRRSWTMACLALREASRAYPP